MTLPELLRSTSARLALTYVTVFGMSVMALGLITWFMIQRSLEARIQEHITADVAQLLGDYRDDGLEELRHDIQERMEASPASRLRYTVQNAQGATIFDRLGELPQQVGWHETQTPGGAPVLVFVQPLDDGYRLGVGSDLAPVFAIRSAVQQTFGIVLGLTLVFGAAGSLVVSRRFASRLETFRKTTEKIGNGSLSERIALAGHDDDLDRLGVMINRMLERIEQLVGNVKRVSTSIAHDMRTPLGRIRQKLETLEGDISEPHQAQVAQIIDQLDESLETFAALLRIAEVESGSRRAGFGQVALGELVRSLVETYGPVFDDQGISLRCTVDANTQVNGDSALLVQATANLLENALHHAKASTVTLTVARSSGGILLRVADDGVGIPESHRTLVTEAFYRVDDSRNTPGNGLGLSLVQAIATLHDARLSLHPAEPGLRVDILFPAVHSRGAGLIGT